MPQQVFDFNQVLGERSEIRGYRYAPIIVQGRLVQGIGGGTCQIASTLHAAAFFAGLEILERRPHTRPSYYIKVGLDATVVYPHINLRLKNPYQFPVVIKFEVKDGWTSAFILGKKRIKKVTFIRKILAETPYEIQEIEDSTLPRGIKILEQRGIPGYKVRRDRILQQGTRWIRERSIDLYPPTPEIIRIGTGNMKKDSVKLPKEDTHPPYTVKRYLKMSQMNNP
jgi:vancomycin resistance protein YoaR